MKGMLAFKRAKLIQLKLSRCIPTILLRCIVFLLALGALQGDFFNRPLFLTASHPKLLAGKNRRHSSQIIANKALDRI